MEIRWATVTSTSPFRVTFLGESMQSNVTYKKPSNYTPVNGDMVAFLIDSKGKYLCLGKFN